MTEIFNHLEPAPDQVIRNSRKSFKILKENAMRSLFFCLFQLRVSLIKRHPS